MLRNMLANVAKEAGKASSGALVGDGGHLECGVWESSVPAKVTYSVARIRKLPVAQAAAIAERLDGASARELLAHDRRVGVRRALTRNPFLDSSTARELYAWGQEQGMGPQEETTLCNGMLSSDLATLANERRYSTARSVLTRRVLGGEELPAEAGEALRAYLLVLAGSEAGDWTLPTVDALLAFMASDRIPVPHVVVKAIVYDERLWGCVDRLRNLQPESVDALLAWARAEHRYAELPSGVTGSDYGIDKLVEIDVKELDSMLVWRILEAQRDSEKYCQYLEKILDGQTSAIRSWHRIVPMAVEARNWYVLEKAFDVGSENVITRLVDSVERAVHTMEAAPKSLWARMLPYSGLPVIRKTCEYGHYKPTDSDIVQATVKATRGAYFRDGDAWAWALREVPMGELAAVPVVRIGDVQKWVRGGYAANPVSNEAIVEMLTQREGRDPEALKEVLHHVELPDDVLGAVLKAATTEEAGYVVEAWLSGDFPRNPVRAAVVRALYDERWASLKWYLRTSQRLLPPAGVAGCDDVLRDSRMYMWVMQQVGEWVSGNPGDVQPHARWMWEVLHGEFGEDEQAWQHLGHYLDSWNGTFGGLLASVRALVR